MNNFLSASDIRRIKMIKNCVPLIDAVANAGVSETIKAFNDLLNERQ